MNQKQELKIATENLKQSYKGIEQDLKVAEQDLKVALKEAEQLVFLWLGFYFSPTYLHFKLLETNPNLIKPISENWAYLAIGTSLL